MEEAIGQVTVVGSANIDFIMRLPRLPERGETVTDGEFRQVFGGKGANSVVAAARSARQGSTAFVARLGNDPLAPVMLESFGNDGIDLTHVTVDADVPSGTALVMIGADGDNYLSVAPGSNALLKPHDVTAATEVISQSAVLLTQMEVPAESVNQALAIASSAGVHCVLNYAPATGQTIQVDRRINTLIVNETEARQLAGREGDDRALAQALHERGPEVVVLTLGSAGVLVLDGDGCRTMPALKVVPVDATAAGDTFCGAYATAIAEGNTVDDAVAFGQTAAALCVTKLGAQPSIPTRDDIEQRLRAGP